MGAAVQAAHARVNGTTAVQLRRVPCGHALLGHRSELMAWVHATLVHASLSAYQRFEHELPRADQEQYYREMALVARIFGTPAEAIPPTLADFRDYFEGQIAGEVIRVTEPAREIARVVLRAPLPGPMRMVLPAHRLTTTRGSHRASARNTTSTCGRCTGPS